MPVIRLIESLFVTGAVALGHTRGICLFVLIAALGWALPDRATAQTFTIIYSFNGYDGSDPQGGLIVSGNTLYGTTLQGGVGGGISDGGVVFALGTDGTGFTNLHIFPGLFSAPPSDGFLPLGGVILLGDTVYGTTGDGGSFGGGTVFSVNTDGSGSSILYSFVWSFALPQNPPQTNASGAFPDCGLVLSGKTLYGTAEAGGVLGYGTVFAINTNGQGFTNLHNFSKGTDGARPSTGLVLSGEVLYGTTEGSVSDLGIVGPSGNGTVFRMKTDGSVFTVLHAFTAMGTKSSGISTNSDGAEPESELVLSDNTLYGTAAIGGTFGNGTVFALNTNGLGFTNLHNFTGTSDGAYPSGFLVLRGDTLYGTTQYGGISSNGTVFAVNTDGTGFTNIYSFTAPTGPSTSSFPTNSDGANPAGGLTLSGNFLYGTAGSGGTLGHGTVFSISLPVLRPPLTITPLGQNVVLSWPTTATGFTLQATTNFGTSSIWATNFPTPVVANGVNTVTNPISGTQQFFRLSQ
jgi:uncharacterized repeat protein (TIGR03803 family)